MFKCCVYLFELFIINQESQGVCVCACAGDRGSSYVLRACRCVAVRELGGGVGVVRTSREVGVAVVKSTPSREGDPTTDNRGVTLVGAANIRRGVRGPSLPAYIRRWVEVILSLSRCVPARLPLGDVGILGRTKVWCDMRRTTALPHVRGAGGAGGAT